MWLLRACCEMNRRLAARVKFSSSAAAAKHFRLVRLNMAVSSNQTVVYLLLILFDLLVLYKCSFSDTTPDRRAIQHGSSTLSESPRHPSGGIAGGPGLHRAHRHRLCRRQGAAAAGRNARALPGPVQRQHHQKREGRHRPQLRRYARHRRGGHPGHRGRRPGPGAGRAGDRDAGGYPDHPGTGEGGLLHLRAGGGRGQPVYRGGAGGAADTPPRSRSRSTTTTSPT